MFKTVTTFLRGKQSEAREAFIDANALTLIDQYLRDAGQDLQKARRALAIAKAQEVAEETRITDITRRITDLEERALAALNGGREDLASDAAQAIADLEIDRTASESALGQFCSATAKLKRRVDDAERRITELDRGRRTARISEAVRQLRAPVALLPNAPSGALADAEATLKRLKERQAQDEAIANAAEEDCAARDVSAIADKLEAAGFGTATRPNARSVLERLKAKAATTTQSYI
jgi:phage shock protein A